MSTEIEGATARATRQGYGGVLSLSLMQLMLVIDTSIVNVALPEIRRELRFSATGASWVITAYALVFGGLVLLSGKVGAMIGPRRALLLGASVFVAASVLGGVATTPAMLVGARALQGVGAASAAPSVLVLLMSITVPGPRRSRAMALFVIAIGTGGALGLVLGGSLATAFGWRSVMFVNVPIGLLALVGVRRLVPEAGRSSARLDVGGALASTVAMAAAVYGFITAASEGWSAPSVVAALVAAGGGLLALVVVERGHPSPVVPPAFFTSMRSAAPFLAMFLIPAGQFGFLYFAAMFTQNVLGYTPLQTGLAVVPFSIALVPANLLTPRLVARFGERVTATAGMIGLSGGLLWMARLDPASSYAAALLGPFVLLGIGAGLTIAPLTAVLLNQAPADQVGAASSLNQSMQQLGGAVGLAVLTTVFGSTGAGDEAQGITTALTFAVVFPLTALVLFGGWARRTGSGPRSGPAR